MSKPNVAATGCPARGAHGILLWLDRRTSRHPNVEIWQIQAKQSPRVPIAHCDAYSRIVCTARIPRTDQQIWRGFSMAVVQQVHSLHPTGGHSGGRQERHKRHLYTALTHCGNGAPTSGKPGGDPLLFALHGPYDSRICMPLDSRHQLVLDKKQPTM